MYDFRLKNWIEKGGVVVIGEGRARLLKLIGERGSIAEAAKEMGMSYRHAWGIIQEINETCGHEVVHAERGGAEGGSTHLTEHGKRLLDDFEKRQGLIKTVASIGIQTPLLAVDGIITINDKLVLVKRKYYPFEGKLALPGGMVEYGETVEHAISREIKEETGLDIRISKLLGVYSNPDRDPRGHIISIAYVLEPSGGELRSGDDAESIRLVRLDRIPQLAFDHNDIVRDYLRSLKDD